MSDYHKTLQQRFPCLSSRFASLPTPRKRKTYSLPEILTGGLSIFLLKEAKLVTADGHALSLATEWIENLGCEQNGWKYIFVLQENSLKSVQEELTLTRCRNPKVRQG